MDLKIIKDIKECEKLWKKFSPNESLWDMWEVAYSFYNSKVNEPFFILLDGKETGLLPLWLDNETDTYHFFGGEYPENRKFWFDVAYFDDFIEQIPKGCSLVEINEKVAKETLKKAPEYTYAEFHKGNSRYFINLKKLDYNIDNYLKTFNKKHRKNLRYDLKQLDKLNYNLLFETDEHYDNFVKLSVDRFGKESDFSDKIFVEQMRNLLSFLKSKDMLHTISIEINEKVQGVEFAALYNNIYYVLNGASNIKIKNLGKLLVMKHIKNAIKLKAKEIDFLSSDKGGWKELWNCEKEDYYDY